MIVKYETNTGKVLEVMGEGNLAELVATAEDWQGYIEVQTLPEPDEPFRKELRVANGELVIVDKEFTKEGAINIRWMEINYIKGQLAELDYKTHKFIDGDLTDAEFAEVTAKRKELRAKINTLEAEIETIKEATQ
jgi:ABC-type phosphate transport system auxiliary subunit